MKKLTALAGAYLPLLSLLLFACRKQDDTPVPTPTPFVWCVLQASPENSVSSSFLEDTLTVRLNAKVDTTRYTLSFLLKQGDSRLSGSIIITDSVVCFVPDAELGPFQLYGAKFSLNAKDGKEVLSHTWSFTTKGPDEYRMTLRSDHVTDGNRDGNRCMQIGHYFYSFGGWKNPPLDSYNDVYRSSGNLSNWERQADAPWHGRHVFGIAKLQDATYIVGGDPLYPDFDVWRTTDGERWKRVANNLLGNRVLYGCVEHKGYIYVVGGAGHSDVWRSRNGADWEMITDNVGFLKGENFAGSLVSFKGRLWMVCGGGDGWGGGVPRQTVWSSEDGREWRQEDAFPGSERYYTDVCVWDNKLWVIGGYNYSEGNVTSIWYMKPNGKWTEFQTPLGYSGRHATGVGVYNNQLVLTCGSYINDCWVIEKVQ